MSHTACGTLPGSPFANVCYDLLGTRIMTECEQELLKLNLVLRLPTPDLDTPPIHAQQHADQETSASDASFVDDNVIAVFSEDPHELEPRVSAACAVVVNVFAYQGMILNQGP